jgi:PKD repeat protein
VVIDPTNHTFNMDNQGTDLNIYKNLKILGWRKNGDGVNAFRNSVVSDCFFRVQDDAFYLGRNVKIHNNTTWNDANGSVMYLTLSDVNSHFKDIKVIYQRAKWHYWSAGRVMCMRNTDGPIENVICQNILIEDPYPSFAPFFATMSSGTYNFSNIVFDNIHQAAKCVGVYDPAQKDNPQNTFFGTSKSIIKNITFRNCFYNGKYLTKFEDDPDWLLNEFVDKSTIKFEVNQVGPPVANFTGAPTKFNQGAVVSFADRSSNGPNTFAWSFPGGTPSTSTEQNPMVTYYTDGKFSVKLVVTNPLGSDTKEMTSYITVYKTPTYILTLNAINGSITKSPDTGTYAAGTDVTLTPVAAHGYEFLNWSGDATGTTNPLVVNMSSNKNITANFISLTNVNKVFDVAYNIYPNPVSEYIYIDLKNVNFRNEIKLINNCGQVVYKTSTNNGKVQIDTKSLNLKGIYLVQVIAGEKVSTQKIIVK